MQVVGTTVVDEALDAVAARSVRPAVSEWAARVLKRHVRREMTLMEQVADGRRLAAALKADDVPEAGRARVTAAFKAGEPVYTPSRERMAGFMVRAADTMDWIESLPNGDRRIRRIERMAWSDAEKLAEAWHASLAKARKVSAKIMDGVRKLADLDDGAFVGELLTAGALKAEGAAMGHCVGGYWHRVATGDTRIVSIRDRDGRPHVTIELASAPIIEFEDGTTLAASHRPRKGVDRVSEANHRWVAVQVRGKQNKKPVERYMSKVVQWLSSAGIPWTEFGERGFGEQGGAVTVYTSFGRHFRSAEAACDYGEPLLAKALAKKPLFKDAYIDSGLAEIHRRARPERVVGFLESSIPSILADVGKRVGQGSVAHKAVFQSGLALVMENLPEGKLASSVRDRLFQAVGEADAQTVTRTEKVIAEVPGGRPLRLVVHSVPLAPMVLLAAGYGAGKENEIAARSAVHLRAVAAAVLADPAAVHVVRAATDGLGADEVRKAFLFCGLAAELAVMATRVEQQVASLVSEARLALRRARVSGKGEVGTLNQSSNLLSEGYERRLADRVRTELRGQFMALSVTERKAAAAVIRPDAADPVVKRYRMP